MTNIGIMQGRLLPPTDGRIQCFPCDSWEFEFALAEKARLDCIEWIYDLYGENFNPISMDAGIDKIKSLSKKHDVKILSVCADYFMDKPLVRATSGELEDRTASLEWLMQRCQLIGIQRIVLPFVDASRIDSDAELDGVCAVLNRILRVAEKTNVEIHLETSLDPDRFAKLLLRLPHPMLKVNYDSGNSAALGYNPHDEFNTYGTRVGSVHIKDRVRGAATVPLGTGDTDFQTLSDELKRMNYKGDFILQVARGAAGEEVIWAEHNLKFVHKHFLA
jgi:L-ribulose-5-phosphate 3-epimerase